MEHKKPGPDGARFLRFMAVGEGHDPPDQVRQLPGHSRRTSFRFPCHCEPVRAWQSPAAICRHAFIFQAVYREIATSGYALLAMTVVIGSWSFWFGWAVIQAGRRGRCRPPYEDFQRFALHLYRRTGFRFPCHCEPVRAWQSPAAICRHAFIFQAVYREIATSGYALLAMTVVILAGPSG